MRESVGLIEALGLAPFGQAARQVWLALHGDGETPRTRFGWSSLRQLRPRYAIPLWLGFRPTGRAVPITNLFNHRQPPPELGWSVRSTDVRDFRGGSHSYDSHNGTDFAVPPGTHVVAPAAGRVLRVSSEYHRGGRKVVVDHGRGLVTTCNHLSRPLVSPGQDVARGEILALSGYSGLDALAGFPWAPPHVHFNVWLNGVPVDPFAPPDGDTLWRRRDPIPARAGEVGETTWEPSPWDETAVDAAIAACAHAGTRDEITAATTPELRAGAALFHLVYFPTRFDRGRVGSSLYRERFPTEGRLDLPFSHLDYDSVCIAEGPRA